MLVTSSDARESRSLMCVNSFKILYGQRSPVKSLAAPHVAGAAALLCAMRGPLVLAQEVPHGGSGTPARSWRSKTKTWQMADLKRMGLVNVAPNGSPFQVTGSPTSARISPMSPALSCSKLTPEGR
jgi:hypothetical protein